MGIPGSGSLKETANAKLVRIDRAICAKSFYQFVVRAWEKVFNEKFLPGRHIEQICNLLQALTEGAFNNLLINIPPGHGKSRLVAVLWPAWRMGPLNDRKDWLCASLAQKLSIRDNNACRDVIKSDWYQARWAIEFSTTQDAKTQWQLVGGGKRDTTSKGANTTGLRAHVRVLDDLHNLTDSPSEVESGVHWYNVNWSSRDNFGSEASQEVIIMQCQGPNDVTHHLMRTEPEEWVRLCLPCEYDPAHHCTTPWGGDWRTTKGELLWPEAYDKNFVERKKRKLGPRAWAAQYQQQPFPEGGREFEPDWLGHKFPRLVISKVERWIISVDCSFKDGPAVDSVSIQLIAKIGAFYYIVDELSDTMSWNTLKRRFHDFHQKWTTLGLPILTTLIEEAANGHALISEFQKKLPGVIPFKTKGESKVSRARATTGIWEAAQVLLPEWGAKLIDDNGRTVATLQPAWKVNYERQFLSFPDPSEHDDSVDSTTQAILYLENEKNAPKGLPQIGLAGRSATQTKSKPRKIIRVQTDELRRLVR